MKSARLLFVLATPQGFNKPVPGSSTAAPAKLTVLRVYNASYQRCEGGLRWASQTRGE